EHARAGAADGPRRRRTGSVAPGAGQGLGVDRRRRGARPRSRLRAHATVGISPLSGESARSVIIRVRAGRNSSSLAFGMPRAGVASDTNGPDSRIAWLARPIRDW